MRRSRRIAWWTAYGLGAAAVIAGLGWTSVRVVRLEREERAARELTERQETLRAALWRLDFWLAPRLARESARTWFDFEPYHPQEIAYNRLLEPIAEGEVLLPSPLLSFESPYLSAHFQWRESTGFTSPQIPSEALVALGTVACGPVPSDPARKATFESRIAGLDPRVIERRIRAHEVAVEKSVGDGSNWMSSTADRNAVAGPGEIATRQTRAGRREFAEPSNDYRARQTASNAAQQALEPSDAARGGQVASQALQQKMNVKGLVHKEDSVLEQTAAEAQAGPVEVGPMVPLWLDDATAGSEQLVLARCVRFEQETVLQGVLVDWPALRSALLAQIESIAPNAELAPTGDIVGDDARRLASIPAILRLAPDQAGESIGITEHPAALGLALVWCAALGAIGATGLALRSSIGSAVRTSRFASSVTHELRTPLTTFRLYAEMLADGVVRDEARKREYYETLRDESARLGLLVENVLAWSRVEDGRTPREMRPTTLEALLRQIEPVLARRSAEGGCGFSVEREGAVDGSLGLTTDPDRVSQVLFNFVDNACKYAGRDANVQLRVERSGDRLLLAVEDSGPGVPDRLRARVFRAFDRGERGPGDAVRGLGLGLAISTELAAALGGRLRCERSAMGGARFVLELPVAR